jgi:hypothetical protein
MLLGGLVWLGRYARDQILDRERFQVAFADIDCQPPPGVDRGDFLDEVMYHARCPERFSILEDGLADKLKQYFTKHPWVAQVDKVECQMPRTVRVHLTYRQAVLAVIVPPELAGSGSTPQATNRPVRGVDHDGALLPKKAPLAAGLPVLDGAPPPSGPAGQPWGNAGVAAAAQTAVLLQPYQYQLKIMWMTLTHDEGLVLWRNRPLRGIKVIWGHSGATGEPTPEVKLQRLLEAVRKLERTHYSGIVQRFIIDLRPPQAVQIQE